MRRLQQNYKRWSKAFVHPVQPAQNLTIFPGATAPQIFEALRQHKSSQDMYCLMHRVQTNLRKMPLDSSDEIYWRLLRQDLFLGSG